MKKTKETKDYIVMCDNETGDCFELPFNRTELNKEFNLSSRIYNYKFYIKKLEEKYNARYFMFINKISDGN